MIEDPLLRVSDVSARITVPEATLRYWRHLGIGPRSAKLGRRVVYRQSDVDAWLQARFDEAQGDDLPKASTGA
jgi:predicted DNA-binding transcriptional regulator AlpA